MRRFVNCFVENECPDRVPYDGPCFSFDTATNKGSKIYFLMGEYFFLLPNDLQPVPRIS